MRIRQGFTLVELLVVVAIIALLLSILLPALSKARQVAKTTKCLSNIRNMELAHQMYVTDWQGQMIDIGLAHGGSHANEQGAWINTLQQYYGNQLLARSPVDTSPHWSIDQGGQGVPVPPTADQYRRTSYGVNNYLSSVSPTKPYLKITQIKNHGETIHYLMMCFNGEFAGADHPHVENWHFASKPDLSPVLAAQQVEINAHGGPEHDWKSISNWSYLDGHAQTLVFEKVYQDDVVNHFNPVLFE